MTLISPRLWNAIGTLTSQRSGSRTAAGSRDATRASPRSSNTSWASRRRTLWRISSKAFRFSATELWGEDADPTVVVSVDAFEPYLEPA